MEALFIYRLKYISKALIYKIWFVMVCSLELLEDMDCCYHTDYTLYWTIQRLKDRVKIVKAMYIFRNSFWKQQGGSKNGKWKPNIAEDLKAIWHNLHWKSFRLRVQIWIWKPDFVFELRLTEHWKRWEIFTKLKARKGQLFFSDLILKISTF